MEIVNVDYIGPGIKASDYKAIDDSLITVSLINSSFGDSADYIETFIDDENKQSLLVVCKLP